MVEDARPEGPTWRRVARDAADWLFGEGDRSKAAREFSAAAAAEGWTRAEVVDRAVIEGAVAIRLPPMAWHRSIDGGDAWMATTKVSDGPITTAVVVFPGADLPTMRAVRGPFDPLGEKRRPVLVGPVHHRWRVYGRVDWATFVGDHLVAEPRWHPANISVAGEVVAARVTGSWTFHPELGALTLALATAMLAEQLNNEWPRVWPRHDGDPGTQ